MAMAPNDEAPSFDELKELVAHLIEPFVKPHRHNCPSCHRSWTHCTIDFDSSEEFEKAHTCCGQKVVNRESV